MKNSIISINSSQLIGIKSNESLINKWLKFSELNNDNTKETYKNGLNKFIEYITLKEVTTITRETILDFKHEMLDKYSNRTVYSFLSAVKSLYKFLEYEDICKDIARFVKLPKVPTTHKKNSLTLLQLKNLLSSLSLDTLLDSRDCCIINLMIRTGLRTCEIINANIEDLQIKEGANVLYILGKGETEKEQYVVIEDDLMCMLDRYLSLRGKYTDKEPLFISLSNNSYGKRLVSVRKIVKSRLRDININSKKISTHSLRHTSITIALMSGASLNETREMARHKDINTTVSYADNLVRLTDSPEHKIQEFIRKSVI